MDWYSMREGLIKLTPVFSGGSIAVILSQNSTKPEYNTVKDLPGFYTRTATAGLSRTVYLSMTDKMTTAKLAKGISSVDYGSSPADYSTAVANFPELLHPNTKYYVHIYYGADPSQNHSQIEFTTTNFPSSFPTSRAAWSAVYNKLSSGAPIEVKKGELYFLPFRIYEPGRGNSSNKFQTDSASVFLASATGGHPFRPSSVLKRLYDFYSRKASGPRIDNFTLFDVLLSAEIKDTADDFHWFVGSSLGGAVLQDFDYNSKLSLVDD